MSRTPADRKQNEGRVLAPLTRSCRLWVNQEAALEGLGIDGGFSAKIRAVVDLGLAAMEAQEGRNQPLAPPAVPDLDLGEGLRTAHLIAKHFSLSVAVLSHLSTTGSETSSASMIARATGLSALETEMALSALVDETKVSRVGDQYRLVEPQGNPIR